MEKQIKVGDRVRKVAAELPSHETADGEGVVEKVADGSVFVRWAPEATGWWLIRQVERIGE